MEPTSKNVFVKEVETETSQFELIGGEIRYQVTHACDVNACKVGDFILFTDSHDHIYKGETVVVVHEDNIEGVEHA